MNGTPGALAWTIENATLVLPEGAQRGPLHASDGRLTPTRPQHGARLDLGGHLVFPGLINAHEHLHLNTVPRLPHADPFANSYAWMEAFQPFFETPAVAAALAVPVETRYRQGGLKNLLSGATTVVHHDFWHAVFERPDFPVRVVARYGWSHSLRLGRGTSGLNGHDLRYGPPVVAGYASTPAGAPWFIHLAEGIDELARAELDQLETLGCLGPNTVLVHGVALTVDDMARVIARGAGLVWCPASNLALLGRTLNPRPLAEAGRLALGTDSRLSGAADLLDELRVAAATSDLAPRELVALVTYQAAGLLRLPDVGGLAAGQAADLLVVRDAGGDPATTLLESRRCDLRAVVRGGVPLVADPDLAPWFEACAAGYTVITVDGRPKLLHAALASDEVFALEPGVTM